MLRIQTGSIGGRPERREAWYNSWCYIVRLYWHYVGTGLELHWCCIGVALVLHCSALLVVHHDWRTSASTETMYHQCSTSAV